MWGGRAHPPGRFLGEEHPSPHRCVRDELHARPRRGTEIDFEVAMSDCHAGLGSDYRSQSSRRVASEIIRSSTLENAGEAGHEGIGVRLQLSQLRELSQLESDPNYLPHAAAELACGLVARVVCGRRCRGRCGRRMRPGRRNRTMLVRPRPRESGTGDGERSEGGAQTEGDPTGHGRGAYAFVLTWRLEALESVPSWLAAARARTRTSTGTWRPSVRTPSGARTRDSSPR